MTRGGEDGASTGATIAGALRGLLTPWRGEGGDRDSRGKRSRPTA